MRHSFRVVIQLWVVVIAVWLGGVNTARAQSLGLACESAWFDGDTRMEYYEDEFGNDVEVWCIRGWFKLSQHYEVRISFKGRESVPEAPIAPFDPDRKVVPQPTIRTAGGCFFDYGENAGPDIFETPGSPKKKFSRVTWTNTDPKTHKEHKFTYDWATNTLTITTTNGTQVTSKSVAPPPATWDDLQKLLPDPAIHACNVTTPAAALGFRDLPYTLTVNVRDTVSGFAASRVDVQVINAAARWELIATTNREGNVQLHLGRSALVVRARMNVLGLNITSRPVTLSLNGNERVDLTLPTLGLPGDMITPAILALVLIVAAVVSVRIIRLRRSHP